MEGLERTLQTSIPITSTTHRRKKRGCRGGRQKKKKRQLESGIFNLTSELLILQEGLKFAPGRFLNKFDTMIDIEKFSRKRNIKKIVMESKSKHIQPMETTHAQSGLKNKSMFNPKPYSQKYIDVFKNLVQEDVKHIQSNKKKKTNKVREVVKEGK